MLKIDSFDLLLSAFETTQQGYISATYPKMNYNILPFNTYIPNIDLSTSGMTFLNNVQSIQDTVIVIQFQNNIFSQSVFI